MNVKDEPSNEFGWSRFAQHPSTIAQNSLAVPHDVQYLFIDYCRPALFVCPQAADTRGYHNIHQNAFCKSEYSLALLHFHRLQEGHRFLLTSKFLRESHLMNHTAELSRVHHPDETTNMRVDYSSQKIGDYFTRLKGNSTHENVIPARCLNYVTEQ